MSAIAVVGALTLSSCSDFLDAENKSGGQNASDYFAAEKGQTELLNSAYNSVKSVVTSTNLNTWGTDLYIETRGKTVDDLQNYSVSAENSTVQSYYTNCYKLINYANGVISFGGTGTNADAAKFLRCYGYYLLTQQFGGVPYITEYINSTNRNYPRENVENVYNSCIAELEGIYNSANLPATSTDGHINKRAIAALLSKFYLAKGWDLGTQLTDAVSGSYTVNNTSDFQSAAKWAETAINNQSLSMSFEKKWSPFNEGNEEEIWSVQYDRANYPGNVENGGHGLQNDFGCYYGQPDATSYKYSTSLKAPSRKALYLWEDKDERYEATFMTKIYNATKNKDGKVNWGTEGYYAYYNCDQATLDTLHIGLRYFPATKTLAAAKNELAEHQAQYAKGAYVNTVQAYIMSDPAVKFTFNAQTGAISKTETKAYDALAEEVYGSLTCKKWDDAATAQLQGNSSNDYRDIVIFHLSDMYLTAAEAYLLAGDDAKALSFVNAVRERSKASTLTSFSNYYPAYTSNSVRPIDVILDERARELWAENVRWTDLRRTKQLVNYNIAANKYILSAADMSNHSGDIKWLRPIPAAEISSNDGISSENQNPGY